MLRLLLLLASLQHCCSHLGVATMQPTIQQGQQGPCRALQGCLQRPSRSLTACPPLPRAAPVSQLSHLRPEAQVEDPRAPQLLGLNLYKTALRVGGEHADA
jgi:hypothetical protein